MEYRTRPEITEDKVEQIKSIIIENPDWNRTRISQHICRLWRWQNPNGILKEISVFRYRNIEMYSDFLNIPIIMQKSWERKTIHYVPSFFVK